jgi:hypothetical protein
MGRGSLHLLDLASIPAGLSNQERFVYINNLIPMDNEKMVAIRYNYLQTNLLYSYLVVFKLLATGALLKYLEANRIGIELDRPRIFVSSLEIANLYAKLLFQNFFNPFFNNAFFSSKIVLIDENTYRLTAACVLFKNTSLFFLLCRALQIFNPESHPAVQKRGSQRKRG